MRKYTFTELELRIVIMKALTSDLKSIGDIDKWIENGMPYPCKGEIKPLKIFSSKTDLGNGYILESYSSEMPLKIRGMDLGDRLIWSGHYRDIGKLADELMKSETIASIKYYLNYSYPKGSEYYLSSYHSLKSACKYGYIIIYKS